ncbi:indole-3-glycerol phosphate synthase TrpC [Candidatus Woesearchaeota archaeon]|nr:indole-3-glycerol phosphate synthase TrpC [Candidatus Woesearchaeota archaeon]
MDELPDVLKRIISRKKLEVAELLKDKDKVCDYKQADKATQVFYDMITKEGKVNIIAEHKRNSPSNKRKGNPPFRPGADIHEVVENYIKGGAAAFSILTDIDFDGKLKDITDAKETIVDSGVYIPILRKDFIINPIQIYEARYHGADAILLITAALDDSQLKDYIQIANGLGMDSLVESHTEAELERSINADSKIFGINNRNLHTFEEDIYTITRILKNHQDIYPVVCESAIKTPEDIQKVQKANPNVTAYLIGTQLMRTEDQIAELERFQGFISN